MIKQDLKTIRKWCKLRTLDPRGVEGTCIMIYNQLDERQRHEMIKEFQDYISGCASGRIIPSLVEMKVPTN